MNEKIGSAHGQLPVLIDLSEKQVILLGRGRGR